MADAQPTVVTALNMHNDLVIEITSASGTGKKQYTLSLIHISFFILVYPRLLTIVFYNAAVSYWKSFQFGTRRIEEGFRKNPDAAVFSPQRFKPSASAKMLIEETAHATTGLTKTFFDPPRTELETLPIGHGGIVEYNGQKAGIYKDENCLLYTSLAASIFSRQKYSITPPPVLARNIF